MKAEAATTKPAPLTFADLAARVFLSEGEAAAFLGVSRGALIAAIGRGEVRAFHIGRSVRVCAQALVLQSLGIDARDLKPNDLMRFIQGLLDAADGGGR